MNYLTALYSDHIIKKYFVNAYKETIFKIDEEIMRSCSIGKRSKNIFG